ncbi:1938_t:CDS:1, partial [Ambispora gerdemannii]
RTEGQCELSPKKYLKKATIITKSPKREELDPFNSGTEDLTIPKTNPPDVPLGIPTQKATAGE